MNDKERLEEIDLNKTYNECGITGDLLSIELKPNDYYDLLEQAERVQELEEEVEHYQSGRNVAVITKMKMDELEQQNKRYREAIEVAIHNIAASENLGIKFALGILEQALEGEE